MDDYVYSKHKEAQTALFRICPKTLAKLESLFKTE